jgi:glyoxylase-like metal-dependent hydrolase (beta-lactamase superfamily II)
VNTYLITSKKTEKAFLIDAGGESSDFLSTLGEVFSGTLEFLLLTHGHFDHISSAAAVCSTRDLPCIVHPEDMKLARHAPFYALRFDGSAVIVPRSLQKMTSPLDPYCSAWGIFVASTPGHTNGSCCYMLDNFIFTGDTLIKNAIGRTDQPGGNSELISQSIEVLLKEAPDDGVILPGHGRTWTVVEAREWWGKFKEKPTQHNTFLS